MCGYCTEQIALDIARNEESWEPPNKDSLPFEICLYLQETKDLFGAIEIVSDIVDDFDKLDPTIANVTLCRLIWFLFENGFNSDYQNLLKTRAVRWAVKTKCSPEMRAVVRRLDVTIVTERLMKLYNPETYLHVREWDRFMSVETIMPDCVAVLQFYVDWWLNGIGLRKNLIAVSSDETTIVDYLNERNDEECQNFDLIYRIFYFALMVISRPKDHRGLIHDMKVRDPYYMPNFFGMDLWLRRMAVRDGH